MFALRLLKHSAVIDSIHKFFVGGDCGGREVNGNIFLSGRKVGHVVYAYKRLDPVLILFNESHAIDFNRQSTRFILNTR